LPPERVTVPVENPGTKIFLPDVSATRPKTIPSGRTKPETPVFALRTIQTLFSTDLNTEA